MVAREALHLPDRLLHRIRRRRALRLLRAAGRFRSVLFICQGNICRSPYASAVFRQRLPSSVLGHVVSGSAGFIGPGRPAPDEALLVARRRGIDLSPHRSQLITADAAGRSDLLVVMEANQAARLFASFPLNGAVLILGDLDPEPIVTRSITDPWGKPEQIFVESYARIERCIDSLISALYPTLAAAPNPARRVRA